MTHIRRYNPHNAPVFVTAVCEKRAPFLKSNADKGLLLSVIREVKREKPFLMIAYVILNDHFHIIIKIPETPGLTTDFHPISQIIQSIKLRFTHRYKKMHHITANTRIWQRRFWDHIIRDPHDYENHIHYIHLNPVKHGYAKRPPDYSWSSFAIYVQNGRYQTDWNGIAESGEAYGEQNQHVDQRSHGSPHPRSRSGCPASPLHPQNADYPNPRYENPKHQSP